MSHIHLNVIPNKKPGKYKKNGHCYMLEHNDNRGITFFKDELLLRHTKPFRHALRK